MSDITIEFTQPPALEISLVTAILVALDFATSSITCDITQPPLVEISLVTASPIIIEFGSAGASFDIDAWVAGLPEYANNATASAALGANRFYVASAASDIAARGTVLRTY